MLQPKRQKHRKQFRGRMKGKANSGDYVSFGEYGLKALDRAWLTSQQIEAARRAVVHYTKRSGKLWLRVFPDKPATAKGLGVGMGAGKGDVDKWVAVIRPGKVIFEIGGVPEEVAREAFRRAGHKLPFPTKIVTQDTLLELI